MRSVKVPTDWGARSQPGDGWPSIGETTPVAQPLAQLEGKYEILEKLGEGGMGAIYKVRHLLMREVRVVKILKSGLDVTEDMKERFLREARAAIQLRHPNVVQLFDFTLDENGTGYIVMEHIDGLTFQDVLGTYGPPPLSLTLELALQCLDALEFLHRQGYTHRDIAPDNLMLAEDVEHQPVAKILDLGIAKGDTGQTALTRAGTFLGKIRYASPEQLTTGQPDHRTDIYSFGIVLYELLTGSFPISGTSRVELIKGHLETAPIPFEQSDPEANVPAPLRSLIMGCLEKDRERRFQTAALLRERLRELRDGLPSTDLTAVLRDVLSSSASVRIGSRPKVPGSTQESLDVHFPPHSTDRHDAVPSPISAFDRTVQMRSVASVDQEKPEDTADEQPSEPPDQLPTEIMRPLEEPLDAVETADKTVLSPRLASLDTVQTSELEGSEDAGSVPTRELVAERVGDLLARVRSAAESVLEQSRPRLLRLVAWVRGHQALTLGVAGAMLLLLVVVVVAVLLWPGEAVQPEAEAPIAVSSSFLIDASPWAEVVAIAKGQEQLLEGLQLTPLRLDLASGSYQITLRGPHGELRTVDATVGDSDRLLVDFEPDPSALLLEFGVIEPEEAATEQQPTDEP